MTVDEYRAQAASLRRQADRARDPAVRDQLLLMAADFETLAEAAERTARQAAAGKP